MINSNLLVLGDFRELRETRRTQDSYKRYLSSLGNSQLETEINFLLNEFSLDTYGKDYFNKVRMVQSEIVSRADVQWKDKIANINEETTQLF